MADQNTTGIGAKAAKLAETLTAYPTSNIYKQDAARYYTKGASFPNLKSISEGKLAPALQAKKDGKEPDAAGKAAITEAEKLVKMAKDSLESKMPNIEAVPLARLVEAANQYYAVGDSKSGNALLDFAIQQSDLIEKPEKDKSGPISTELKAFKAAVDEHYKGKAKEMEPKSPTTEKKDGQTAIDLAKLVADMGSIELNRAANTIPNLKGKAAHIG